LARRVLTLSAADSVKEIAIVMLSNGFILQRFHPGPHTVGPPPPAPPAGRPPPPADVPSSQWGCRAPDTSRRGHPARPSALPRAPVPAIHMQPKCEGSRTPDTAPARSCRFAAEERNAPVYRAARAPLHPERTADRPAPADPPQAQGPHEP